MSDTATSPGAGQRPLRVLGVTASMAALLSTPVLGALGELAFVPGLVLAVGAPAVFGAVAVAAGAALWRRDHAPAGRRVVAAGVLATLVGVAYGLSTVF